MCDEYGADVIGVVSDAPAHVLVGFAKEMASATDKPLLVDASVRRKDRRQFEPTDENPYPTADAVVELAVRLRAQGVQFLRASGAATPAYTGALLATVGGGDVVAPQ